MNIFKQKLSVSLATVALVTASFALPAAAASNGTTTVGPFAGTTTDGGSCSVDWANDTYNLVSTVHDNGDGTFRVHSEYKDGAFTTLGTTSPGKCETANNHGATVAAGVIGSFQGFVDYTVTSSTFDPGASNPFNSGTRAGFIAAAFGPSATQSDVSFNFEYNSSDKTLKYHHWQDKSDNTGVDKFVGDIANN